MAMTNAVCRILRGNVPDDTPIFLQPPKIDKKAIVAIDFTQDHFIDQCVYGKGSLVK